MGWPPVAAYQIQGKSVVALCGVESMGLRGESGENALIGGDAPALMAAYPYPTPPPRSGEVEPRAVGATAITKYYYFNGSRIGMDRDGVLYYGSSPEANSMAVGSANCTWWATISGRPAW